MGIFDTHRAKKTHRGRGEGGVREGKGRDGKTMEGWRVCRKTPMNERKTGKKNETKPSFCCWSSPKKERGKKMKKGGGRTYFGTKGVKQGMNQPKCALHHRNFIQKGCFPDI